MKRNLLPLMFLAAFALLAVAIAVDCVRLANDASARVLLADAELIKHEQRLAKLLDSSPTASPELKSALADYRAARDIESRHAAYDHLVAIFQQTTPAEIDAKNPLDRKQMDDTAGAINRRQIAEKPFDQELAAYQAYLHSWRGTIARVFLPPAAHDSQLAERE